MDMTKQTETELVEDLRLAIMRLARRLRQQAEADVTPSMLSALATLEGAPRTLGELAQAERVTPPTMTRIVVRLEERNLVVREQDPTDRRIARIRLTGDGRRLIARNRSRKNAYLARRLRALDDTRREDVAAAVALLERLLEDPE
ncbi:MAG TPA: MarR family transcriptional regulator [Actinomycetota bacterium]|nr:MarR family transcriptional regulator [Actinomycetota bacterium]